MLNGEAGTEKGIDVGKFAAETGDAFAAAHAASDFEVEEDHIERRAEVAGAAEGGDRFRAVAHGIDLEPLEGEDFFDDDADAGVVVHDQDSAAAAGAGGGGGDGGGAGRGGAGFGGGQEGAERGAGAWGGVDFQASFVGGDDGEGLGQA